MRGEMADVWAGCCLRAGCCLQGDRRGASGRWGLVVGAVKARRSERGAGERVAVSGPRASDKGWRARALWTKGERAEGTGPRQLGRTEGNKKKQAGLGCAGLGLGEKLGRARKERERGRAGQKGIQAGPLG